MTEQKHESLEEKQKKLIIKLDAIDELQAFYKKNESGFLFRLFFPTRLGKALLNENYDFKEVYAAYFGRRWWMRFFFGLFPEIVSFTTAEASVKAFSVLDKGDDLVVNYTADDTNAFSKYVVRTEIMSFLQTSSEMVEFEDFFFQYRGIKDDPIIGRESTRKGAIARRNEPTITETTISNLDGLSEENKLRVLEIIQTVDKQTRARSKGKLLNWSFPLLKIIIDKNKTDLLEVLYDLLIPENSIFSSGNIKTYTVNLLCLPDAYLQDVVEVIRLGKMDLGSRMTLLNYAMDQTERRDIGLQRYFAEKAATARREEKRARLEAEQKSANDSEMRSQSGTDGENTVVDGFAGLDTSSVSSANTDSYDSRDNTVIFLSNLSWWHEYSTNREPIREIVLAKSPAEQEILRNMCNKYGFAHGSEFSKERFLKILSLSTQDLLALESLIIVLQGEEPSTEGSLAKAVSIGKIVDGAIPSAKKGLRYSFFGGLKKASDSLSMNQQDLDDSSVDSLTTTSSSSVDSVVSTALQELADVVKKCDKTIPDILDKLLEKNNFNPAVKVINKLLSFEGVSPKKLREVIQKLLTLSEEQIMDVYTLLIILEKPLNHKVCTFSNLNEAIQTADEHTIISDLRQYDKLFSGDVELDQFTLLTILADLRAPDKTENLQNVLQPYQTNQAAISHAVSQTAGIFSKSARSIAGSLGRGFSSMMHNDSDKPNDMNRKH